MGTMKWQPSWWKEDTHGSSWDRAKDAMKRDWEQTKADVHAGGHELKQNVTDTVKQAAGKEAIPTGNQPNTGANAPGNWNDAELPLGYGFGAREQYGTQHAKWNDNLETTLRSEWEQAKSKTGRSWDEVKTTVRRGYEAKH